MCEEGECGNLTLTLTLILTPLTPSIPPPNTLPHHLLHIHTFGVLCW